MKRIVEGESFTVEESFFYVDGSPALPADGRSTPEVFLVDESDDCAIILKTYAMPADESKIGKWTVQVGVPLLDLDDDKSLTLLWLFETEEGTFKTTNEVIVEPAHQARITDIIALREDDNSMLECSMTVPTVLGENFSITIAESNKVVHRVTGETECEDVVRSQNKTYITFKANLEAKRLAPLSLLLRDGKGGLHTYVLWVITPQVTILTKQIEDHINKARLENVIPELEYTQADLVLYAHRGLNLFNQLPPSLTAFTGMNMQGILLDCHVICSCYYALAAQLQAEGALAFDFSGQAVSFNVDRSPSIEAALGRIETQIGDQVKQTKRLLGKKGIFQGDGSIGGGPIDGSSNFGRLSLSNTALARRTTFGGSSYMIRNSR